MIKINPLIFNDFKKLTRFDLLKFERYYFWNQISHSEILRFKNDQMVHVFDEESGMRVSFEQLKQEFERVLLARGVQAETASEIGRAHV